MPSKNKPKRFDRNRSVRVARRKRKEKELIKGKKRIRTKREKIKGIKTIDEKMKDVNKKTEVKND